MRKFASLVVVYSTLLSFALPVRSQTLETFKLRDAGAAPKDAAKPRVKIDNLGDAETNAVLARLPELPLATVKKPGESIPNAPKRPQFAGSSAEIPAIPKVAQSSELAILRATPSGSVAFAGDLSVTFNQPMIGISLPERASEQVPVKLSPSIPGRWRWLGTKTLIFDADKRFPMATAFTTTIPAGTKSQSGAVLKEDYTWRFQTAVPLVESTKVAEMNSSRPDAVIAIKFNQRIDPSAVLATMTATADAKPVALRLASDTEIAADKTIAEFVKDYPENQWLAVRAGDGFPLASKIIVTNEAGTPSTEGPLTMPVKSTFQFNTYAPLAVTEGGCTGNCVFYNELQVFFNNPIDAASVDETSVTVDPKIDDLKVDVSGNSIEISGVKESRKKYRVTVSPKVRDVFGQTLGRKSSVVIETAAREPALQSELAYRRFVTLDPASKKQLSVSSVNIAKLRVRLRRVQPEDYAVFENYRETIDADDGSLEKIGAIVYDRVVKVKSKPDEYETTTIDLAPALNGGFGHVIVECFPEGETDVDRILVWIQSTRIAVDAFSDAGATHVYASELANGKPLGDVEIGFTGGETVRTSATGLAVLKTPSDGTSALVARLGADSVLVTSDSYKDEWAPDDNGADLRWFVFDDRGLYRPGETVSIKGYVRRASAGPTTDIEDAIPGAAEVAYVLSGPRGVDVTKGTAKLNSFGAFDFKIVIPEGIDLGTQYLRITTGGDESKATHSFDVREFRRPEFEVSSTVVTPGPIIAGGTAVVAAEAKYFSGGGLKDAETNWTVRAVTSDYAPPGHDDFNFGIYRHWWESRDGVESSDPKLATFAAKTDAAGIHRLAVDTAPDNNGLPRVFTAAVSVADVNRQSFSSSSTFLVHPADRYIGLRSARTFVMEGDKTTVEAIVTDIDGAVKAGANFEIVGELKSWRRVDDEWTRQTVDTQRCSLVSTSSVLACDFTARTNGDFDFTATVTDAAGRKSVSRFDITVAGGGFSTRSYGELEQEKAEMIPDKKAYAPGETAEILVNAPFFPAEGVMTLRRNGVLRTERFTMDRAFTVVRIPIEEGFLPNLSVKVDLLGKAKRVLFDDENDDKLPPRPAFAGGEVALAVKLDSRRLRVSAEPRSKELLPGGETAVDVAVAGPDGKPLANSEVALVAVDESVLALSGMKIREPLGAIYKYLESNVEDRYSRSNVMLADFFDLDIDLKALGLNKVGYTTGYGSGSGDGMGSGELGGRDPLNYVRADSPISFGLYDLKNAANSPDAIRVRRNFDALALFSPSVVTDANGRATVAIKLPDSLTRYRITAVATNGAKLFGSTESNLTATQPLSVRPSAPRFLNLGDTAEIPVVVKNDGRVPQTVDVAIRASNINFKSGNGRRVTVPAGDRAEIRFPVTTSATGTARFQVAAVSGGAADAAEFSFPVLTPATSESFATYGTVADNGVFGENVEIPGDIYRDFGGIEVTTSSTRLQDLTDAFLYLQNYPFDCSEQLSSRILSVAALGPVLSAFKSPSMPTKDAIDARMASDIAILEKRQHADGGFNYWTKDGASLPFLSVHVTHALVRASAAGYKVSPNLLEKALDYTKNIERNLALAPYGDDSRLATRAFAAYVRTLAGRDDGASEARQIVQKSDLKTFTPETLGWLFAALGNDEDTAEIRTNLRRELLNRVTETADTANFASGFTESTFVILTSDRRNDAVVLDALLGANDAAKDELLPKVANGLLAGRKRGYWSNTQDNAFVLTALGRYFATFEAASPDFKTRAWLGEKFIGEAAFKGRENTSRSFGAPFTAFSEASKQLPFVIQKQGAGRLYYRVGMTFAPRAERVTATDNGFEVIRTISAADAPSDMRLEPDGGFVVRAGARLKIKLTLVATAPRNHVALVDHLAAGFETIDRNLGGTEKPGRAFVFRWFEHENLRDDRVELFASYLQPGVYEYEYFVRATTPGAFIVPPAKAEEMYASETFGRTASTLIVVE